MEREHMEHLLHTAPGIGVEVTTKSGSIVYYFYEDFNGPADGINRAMKQLYPQMDKGNITALKFIEYHR